MNVCDSMSIGGFGLNSSQQLVVKNSLKKIKLNEKLSNDIHLWGKIFGRDRDYFIACAHLTNSDNHIQKKFFFSIDGGVNFGSIPVVDEWIHDKNKELVADANNNNNINNYNSMFIGDPSHIYKSNTNEEEEEHEQNEDEEQDDEEKKKLKANDPAKRKLTELERLACIINDIDHDTCLIPRGKNFPIAKRRCRQ